MKKLSLTLILLFFSFGCESFVENAISPISYVNDDDINTAENIPFLMNGVLNNYSRAHSYVSLWADLLSDAIVNDGKVQGSTDVRGEYLDNGIYDPTAGTYSPPYEAVAQAWRSARTLKNILVDIEADASVYKSAYYTAYLYQALPCYLLGTYFGRGSSYPSDGGATLDKSAFKPSSELLLMATAYFDSALVHADEEEIKIINSLLARQNLYSGNFSEAADYASVGLQAGEEPFMAIPGLEDPWPNWYWTEAGNNRTRYTLASRFKYLLGEDFVDSNSNGVWDTTEVFTDCAIPGADVGQGDGNYNGPTEPEESIRLSMSVAGMTPGESYSRYFQTKYPNADSPIPIINWQETYLIIAELSLRGESVSISAIDAVNSVRSNYGLEALDEIDLNILLHERDKELFCQGQRIIDQNRFQNFLAGIYRIRTHGIISLFRMRKS
jgi:hypothetical protein